MKPVNIELHIEELALYGFQPGEGHAIALALERELASLFAREGLPSALAEGLTISRLDAGAFDLAQGYSAESAGRQAGQTIFGGFSR